MDYDHIKMRIYNTNNVINRYKHILDSTICPYQKFYYDSLIKQELRCLRHYEQLIKGNDNGARNNNLDKTIANRQKVFTLAELAQYDGVGGKPAYVAVNGIVYDVSFNPTWGGGTHFGLYAGQDLTAQFAACHAGTQQLLDKLPKVGVLDISP